MLYYSHSAMLIHWLEVRPGTRRFQLSVRSLKVGLSETSLNSVIWVIRLPKTRTVTSTVTHTDINIKDTNPLERWWLRNHRPPRFRAAFPDPARYICFVHRVNLLVRPKSVDELEKWEKYTRLAWGTSAPRNFRGFSNFKLRNFKLFKQILSEH